MELNTGRSDDDDDDDDDEEDDEHNDVCSSVPLTIADISLYYHWKFGHGHDLWLDIYALNNRIWTDHWKANKRKNLRKSLTFTPKGSIL